MQAKITSVNGVTRLHSFEIDLKLFKRVGGTMQAHIRHAAFGLPADKWPDNFSAPVVGHFFLRETKPDGTRFYSSESANWIFVKP